MEKLILIILNLLILFIQVKPDIPLNNNKKNNNIIRKLTQKEEIQKLNNIVYMYNPYDIVSYISPVTNKNGDLFILLSSEERVKIRLIYAIKSDGSNYFSDTNDIPYKIFEAISEDRNFYPLITILKLNNVEYILTFSHASMFELYEFSKNEVYSQGLFQIIKYNSNVYKNTFVSLNYYNNSDFILNAYIDKRERYFLLQKLHFKQVYIPSRNIQNYQNQVGEADYYSQVSCFEISNFIECLYVDEYKKYTLTIFNITDLELLFSQNIEDIGIGNRNLFSKCIHIKDYIGAFIYFREIKSPNIKFKIFKIISEKDNLIELEDYRNPIIIDKYNNFSLGYNYIYNDIIKIDENNLIYVNSNEGSDKLIIIIFKLSDKSQNILINYYKIELKEKYNIRIYKDINIFKFNGLLGIAMTNYNFNLNENKTYASYFIVGEAFPNNLTLPYNINIFDEENKYELKIKDFINIKNNIFGYILNEIKILSFLNKNILGFYLYSNELQKIVEVNESISGNDTIKFILISDLGIKLNNYIIEYEGKITDSNYNDFISFPDSYEYYSNDNTTLELFYESKTYSIKNGYINISVQQCYKTCETCSYLGDNITHHCDTCSKEYPFIYKISNSTLKRGYNCINACPENYTFIEKNKTKICISYDDYKEMEALTVTTIDFNDPTLINNKIIELIGYKNYIQIAGYIKNISGNQIIIKNISNISNFTIYGYEIGENKEEFFSENNLIYIDFLNGNVKKEIIDNLNLSNNTNIYVLILESESKYNSPVTNDFDFVLFFENGTEININKYISVNISAPITNLDLAHYDYAIYYKDQGYDIYDKDSPFYNDFCIPISYENNDITIDDRKKEIYPNNITIVKPNCIYKKADLENKRLVCEYNFEGCLFQNNIKDDEITSNYFEIQEENFFYYLLDYINYKILTCPKIFFQNGNYLNNIGFIFCTISSFLVMALIVSFFIRGFSKIKNILHNDIPTYQKLQKLIKEKYNKNTLYDYKKNKTSSCNPKKRKSSSKKVTYGKGFNNNSILQSKSINSSNSKKENTSIINLNYNNENIENNKYNNYDNNINNIYHKRIRVYIKSRNKNNYKKKLNYKFKNKIKSYSSKKIIKQKAEIINNYNDLPYTKAIKLDKRSLFKIFKSKLFDKLELIDIFISKEIKELYLSKYFLFIIVDVMMNALLFSDSVISHKFHNNGKLDSIVTFSLTIASNFISLLIEHYISLLIRYDEAIEQIKEIKQEDVYIKICKKFYRILIIQAIAFFITSISFISLCYYYLVIFCRIYEKSQISLLKTYLISFAEGFATNVFIAIVITCTRIFGIRFKNKYIYNTSKYIDQYF